MPTLHPGSPRPQAGLRGINLSGGQRQRLNLARCAYFGGDLVLLDNALSAVDHHTAQHIFEHCIKNMFKDKATVLVRSCCCGGGVPCWQLLQGRVLPAALHTSAEVFSLPQLAPAPDLGPAPPPPAPQVTHQVDFLPQCDKVAIMDDGTCVYFGPWCDAAAIMLSKYLPAQHLLAAAGGAEQPRETKPKKDAPKKEAKKDQVRRRCWVLSCPASQPLPGAPAATPPARAVSAWSRCSPSTHESRLGTSARRAPPAPPPRPPTLPRCPSPLPSGSTRARRAGWWGSS
jgi:hypothetical protein